MSADLEVGLLKLEEDLSSLWPALSSLRFNRDQILVVRDGDGAIVGGVVMWDGGHDAVYAGEAVATREDGRRYVFKALIEGMADWARKRNKKIVLFHASESLYQS